MINAFEVYLFMEASSFALALALLAVGLVLYASAASMVKYTEAPYGEVPSFKKEQNAVKLAIVLGFTAIMIPSKQTMAAMYILPKLTSKEFVEPVTAEAKEIYQLLKKALKEHADGPDTP